MELWKCIKGHEERYEVSNFGNIRSLDRVVTDVNGKIRKVKGRDMKKTVNNAGYYVVNIGKGNLQLVHRLVGEAFIYNDRDDRDCINHIDGNKLNNHHSNLEWVTKGENNIHSHENNLSNVKKPIRGTNLKTGEIIDFESARQAEREVGVSYRLISATCNGRQKSAGGYRWEFI